MRRKTKAEHMIHGTWRERDQKAHPSTPNVPEGASVPAYLDVEARKEWRRIVKLLPDGVIQEADKQLLASYCVAYSLWRNEITQIKAEGTVIEEQVRTSHGVAFRRKRNPRVSIAADFQRQMLAAGKLFGLSALDRQRIVTPEPKEPEEQDESGDILKRLEEQYGD